MLTGIALFIVDKMSSYIAWGMKPDTAAHFTMGELDAIYKDNHYSRDASGAMRKTLQPEALNLTMAMRIANDTITEILNHYTTQGKVTAPEALEEYTPREISRTVKVTGLEGLKNYTKRVPA